METKKVFACFFIVLVFSAVIQARPQNLNIEEREADPGWVRRQLIRAGEAASRVGNGLGGYAVKLSNAVDKICNVIKKIIPIVGAVCTVGQFKFCALENVTGDIGEGNVPIAGGIQGRSANFNSQINLDEQD